MSSAANRMLAIEGPQYPDRGGYDSLTLEELMSFLRVPGLGLSIIEDFAIHWSKGYGIADVQDGTTMDVDTLFQAGSISKPVATMAMLKAVEERKFFLDDDINNVLRTWQLADTCSRFQGPVTPRMLASHTAGLGDGFGFPGYSPGQPLPTIIQILDGSPPSNVGPVFMERPPLTAMKYSGGGSTILQLVLTDILERPFADIVAEWVLRPIGMTHSMYEQPLTEKRILCAARGHDVSGNCMDAKYHVYPELYAAGLWTTPTDLAKFAIEVQTSALGKSNRVLSKATVSEMLNPVGVGDFSVGFIIARQGQGWYFSHGGKNWGFVGLLRAHKLRGYGFAAMTNSANGQLLINELAERIERAYEWDSLHKPVPR